MENTDDRGTIAAGVNIATKENIATKVKITTDSDMEADGNEKQQRIWPYSRGNIR